MTVTFADIELAANRIESYVHRTPIVTSQQLNKLVGCELFFKCENFQKAGAFKSRGAVNAVFSLEDDLLAKGVATHSSGNHGAALARAAQLRGSPAYIVVPDNAKHVKRDAIRGYGGELILSEPTLPAREAKLAEVVRNTSATIIHPYNDPRVISGQATAALELTEQVDYLDCVITPVGGGGLLAGSSIVGHRKGLAIYGAEPTGADDAYRSIKQNSLVTHHVPDTICDGLLTTLGDVNYNILQEYCTGILLASDEETIAAMRLLWTRTKMLVEPSSAITLAAVLKHAEIFRGKRVGLILTGGNVDLGDLPF
jgi:threonine dehydratase